jgi:hypothetical protein
MENPVHKISQPIKTNIIHPAVRSRQLILPYLPATEAFDLVPVTSDTFFMIWSAPAQIAFFSSPLLRPAQCFRNEHTLKKIVLRGKKCSGARAPCLRTRIAVVGAFLRYEKLYHVCRCLAGAAVSLILRLL